ncbi:glycosyl transferase, partial [Bradyrhizobium canariense]
MSSFEILLSLIAAVLAASISAVLIRATRPVLLRVALAKPNARSSHRIPTPQGAGIAVTAATLLAAGIVIVLAGSPDLAIPFTVFAACLFIAVVG